MIKVMVAVWCNYTGDNYIEKACIQKVTGDNTLVALSYARRNNWYINGGIHLCPYHKPKDK